MTSPVRRKPCLSGPLVAAVATAAAGAGAGAGPFAATTVVELAEPPGLKVAMAQVSECGANATSSPFMPDTRRPFTAVDPEPCSMLSEPTARVKGPPLFSMCTRNWEGAFSTV